MSALTNNPVVCRNPPRGRLFGFIETRRDGPARVLRGARAARATDWAVATGCGQAVKRLINRYTLLLLGLALMGMGEISATGAPEETISGATPLEWSQRMAGSEMARLQGKPAKWDYTMGQFTLALLKLDEAAPDPRYLPFVEHAIGSLVSPEGKIAGYKVEEYQLDALNPGKTLLALWQRTHEARYEAAARRLYHQLESQPRTFDGGFWHKQRYTNQMWLDGAYMAGPFYAECAGFFSPASAFDDAARQMHLLDVHTYDARSGLFYHGWDAARSQPWANPVTGTSSNFWGRAIGWYGMALADMLDFIPPNHPARGELIATYKKLCAGMVKHQDAATGLWYQVVDQGQRPGNYLEATVSTMMIYAMAKGIRQGYLPRDYLPAVEKSYRGVIEHLVAKDGTGEWSLANCCSVAGLGGSPSNGHERDGSFSYYVGEPVVKNDLKGVSPFVLDGIELQRLLNPK